MNEAAFDDALDALVRGEQPDTSDNLTRFAADLYRKEHGMTMPSALKSNVAHNLGLEMSAPVSNRTRRARALPLTRRQPRWLTGITVALAALLALTGVFQWSMRTENGDNRFGVLSPAVPTAEATPVATPAGDIGWLNPITPEECVDDVALTTEIPDAGENPYLGLPDRAYSPFTSPASYTRGQVFQRVREIRACLQTGTSEPGGSSRMIFEMNDREFVTSDAAERLWANQIVEGKKISEFYASELNVSPATLSLEIPAGTEGVAGITPGRYVVINPNWIVQLADGRVVVLVSMLTVTPVGTPVAEPVEPTAGFGAWVFVRQEGEWMLDESLPVCFGECDEFWESRPGANLLVTPAPTIATCRHAEEFIPDYEVSADAPVNLRPGPGIQSGNAITAVPPGTPLMYLCENAPSRNLEVDELYESQVWLKVRTERGEEGWMREVDVKPHTLGTPAPTPTISPDVEIVPVGGDSQVRPTPTPRPSPTGTEPPEIEPIDVTPTPAD